MGKHESKVAQETALHAEQGDNFILVRWADGTSARFHDQWLRDNCRSEARFDVRTEERKSLTEKIPGDLRARDVRILDDAVVISWSDGAEESRFDGEWLRRNIYDGSRIEEPTPAKPWGSEYAHNIAAFDHSATMTDDVAAADMIRSFEAYGLIHVRNVPTVEMEVERFADRLAYVREIVFDRVADIRVSVDPYTLGFTNAALPLHTDCSGYSWPPNVMVFHCLANEVAGGASQYVDGVQVITQLRTHAPEALRILTEYDVEFRLWSRQADTMSQCPPIILDAKGELALLRYANWAVQPLRTVPFDRIPAWYDAWRALAERVNAPENRVAIRCEPGDMLLINNHRILHGRDAFDDGQGLRHFQQVYMELDDLKGFRRIVEGQGGAR